MQQQQDSQQVLLAERTPRDIGGEIAQNAREWAGKSFKPGERERCQDFVNSVLNQTSPGLADTIGTTRQAQDGMASGVNLASRFSGGDVAKKIPLSEALPGDIVMFKGTYGEYRGTDVITHVGIYVGDGMMVDRPTANEPVKLRSVNTFGEDNVVVYRPHAYEQLRNIDTPPFRPQQGGLRAGADSGAPSLIQQADSAIARLPTDHFKTGTERDAAVLGSAFTAYSAKFEKIAEVMPDPSGKLWVLDRALSDPTAQRAAFDPSEVSKMRVGDVMAQLEAQKPEKAEAVASASPSLGPQR